MNSLNRKDYRLFNIALTKQKTKRVIKLHNKYICTCILVSSNDLNSEYLTLL